MKSSGRNISLTSYDDLFSTEEIREARAREQIQQILLSELYPFKDHPFRVVDDDRMMETVESIKEYGVLVPAIARPLEEGGYEIIAGHRRKRACELAGLDTMPVIVRDLDRVDHGSLEGLARAAETGDARSLVCDRLRRGLRLARGRFGWCLLLMRGGLNRNRRITLDGPCRFSLLVDGVEALIFEAHHFRRPLRLAT